jgi:hypothetical protein
VIDVVRGAEKFVNGAAALVGGAVVEEGADLLDAGDAPAEVEIKAAEEVGVVGGRCGRDAAFAPDGGEFLVDAFGEGFGGQGGQRLVGGGGEGGQENRQQQTEEA